MDRRILLSGLVATGVAAANRASAQAPAGASPLANAPGAVVTIYHLENRRSERIVWLCEELNLPYNIVYHQKDLGASMDEIRKIRPLMPAAPTVKLKDGHVLSESEAIIRTLIDREAPGKLTPPVNSPDYPDHNMWMGFAEGTLAADIVADYRSGMATGGKRPKPAGSKGLTDGERAVKFADDFLTRHPYFGGANFTAADIMMFWPSGFAERINLVDMKNYPNLTAWQAKMEARPAFKRMVAVARPNGRVGPLVPLKSE